MLIGLFFFKSETSFCEDRPDYFVEESQLAVEYDG